MEIKKEGMRFMMTEMNIDFEEAETGVIVSRHIRTLLDQDDVFAEEFEHTLRCYWGDTLVAGMFEDAVYPSGYGSITVHPILTETVQCVSVYLTREMSDATIMRVSDKKED